MENSGNTTLNNIKKKKKKEVKKKQKTNTLRNAEIEHGQEKRINKEKVLLRLDKQTVILVKRENNTPEYREQYLRKLNENRSRMT